MVRRTPQKPDGSRERSTARPAREASEVNAAADATAVALQAVLNAIPGPVSVAGPRFFAANARAGEYEEPALPNEVQISTAPAHDPVQAAVERIALHYSLSAQQCAVLFSLAQGLSNDAMTARLGVTRHAVQSTIRLLNKKLGTTSRADLVTFVLGRHGGSRGSGT
jgi:DNA-binding CsgD family transcriptional regulator